MKKLVLSLFCCLLIFEAFAQTNNNLTLRGHVAYSKPISNLWGYVDSLGNEYALVGAWNGVSIVNVTNPDSPKVVKTIPSVHPISGQSVTREVKTWKTFAYSTNDNQTDSGLLIIDLSHLPDTNHISYHQYISHGLTVGHTLWVDEHGILYVYGFDTTGGIGNYANRGAMLFDLNQDPYNPRYITQYNGNYIHDGFVRGDTLWASEIFAGQFAVINVKDTNNLKQMATQHSYAHATHNAWPTANNQYVFVTDETMQGTNCYLQSFDVSDLANITPLDMVQSNPGSGSTVHNVHLINDTFAVTSYYTDGVVIFDVSHPDNMIEVGNYDTSPLSGPGYIGCWGVYPFLPSHNILASDIQQGLFVFTPHYKHACWLEGNVTDSSTSASLGQVIIKLLPSLNNDTTDFLGNYKTGTVDSGKLDVQFSKYGYITKIVHGVNFQPNVITTLNVQLRADSAFNLAISITDSFNNPVKYAKVWITDNSQYSTISTTDSTGKLLTKLYSSTYDIYAGAWGYKTIKLTGMPLTVSTDSLHIKIGRGYYDDFTFDFGWQSTGTAATGLWARISPTIGLNNGLPLNPTTDVQDDIGNQCYLTGNQLKNLGVEGGTAILTSPAFDLSAGIDPNLQYYKWFTDYNSGKQPTDSLVISLSNGNTTVTVDEVKPGKDSLSAWIHNNVRIKNFLPLTSNMHLIVSTSQASAVNDIVAALDKFEITDSLANAVITLTGTENNLQVYPNPFANSIYIKSNLNGLKNIEVFNLLGEKVYQNTFNEDAGSPIKLNLSGLVKGVYFVKELTLEGTSARMIIKE